MFYEDHAGLRNMRRYKQGFEALKFNAGYEDDVNTTSTLINCTVYLKN
jgi:hypothetical protein